MSHTYYTIDELSELTGITDRTIRYYTTEGLLPPPETRGRYALYGETHLQRLQLVVRLKEAYLPLGTIKSQMEKLGEQQVTALLSPERFSNLQKLESDSDADVSDAAQYLARILEGRRLVGKPSPEAGKVTRRGRRFAETETIDQGVAGETWKRIAIRSGIELQVRVPLSRANQILLPKLLDAVQTADKEQE